MAYVPHGVYPLKRESEMSSEQRRQYRSQLDKMAEEAYKNTTIVFQDRARAARIADELRSHRK